MFVHYRTPAFILEKTGQGEADQILTVFTKDFGKLEILGKAIRKIKSKLRSGIELFYLSEVEFIQGKTYKTLTDAVLIEKFQNIGKNLKRLKIAFEIPGFLDNLVKFQEPDEKIWNLLVETFQKLNSLPPAPRHLSLVYYFFIWNLFSALGYQPELGNCSICQKRLISGPIYFSSKEGGTICSQCEKSLKSAPKIEIDVIKILRILLKGDWSFIKRLKIAPPRLKELKVVSNHYYSYLLKEISSQ